MLDKRETFFQIFSMFLKWKTDNKDDLWLNHCTSLKLVYLEYICFRNVETMKRRHLKTAFCRQVRHGWHRGHFNVVALLLHPVQMAEMRRDEQER